MAEITYLKITDRFYKNAKDLRKTFEGKFSNPFLSDANRFVWDYWNVPDQYNILRTPAEKYFPEKQWARFQDSLVKWGQENLGCHSISQPWLSYYIEGCEMALHADIPHGPWAYVFSLTPSQRKFKGGETLILKPQTLRYWSSFNSAKGLEANDLTEKITPDFNRLIVFDPRIPHAVTRVENTRDPLEARLVIHGWFVQPRPFVQGALAPEKLANELEDLVGEINHWINENVAHLGTLTFRFQVNPQGKVGAIKILTNTLVSHEFGWVDSQEVLKGLKHLLGQFSFAKSKGNTKVTVPIVFG